MITLEKINVYNIYNGDIDSWARSGTSDEKSIINDKEWFIIEEFIQEIYLVKKGLAANSFSILLNERLKNNCQNEEVINKLRQMS